MVTFSEAQLLAWITPLIWPFLRVLALFSSMPVFGTKDVPVRVRIALSGFIAFASQPSLAPIDPVALDSPAALMLIAQQLLIGIALGFAVRIVFTAIEFAGELIGLQMGLNYGGFFDPVSASSSTAPSQFFGNTVTWLFVVINGHLLVIAAMMQSFTAFPVGPEPFAFLKATRPELWGAEIFSIGLWLALPLIAMLLFVNLVMGAISRVAQQMNIFSVGFPITVGVGLLGMLLTLPAMQAPFTAALERMLALFQ